jgi:hypothetical protein
VMALIALFAPMARSTNRSTPFHGDHRMPATERYRREDGLMLWALSAARPGWCARSWPCAMPRPSGSPRSAAFTGTAAGLPFAGQLLSPLGAPYNPRGHNLRRFRPSRHGNQRARRMTTGTVDLVREDY